MLRVKFLITLLLFCGYLCFPENVSAMIFSQPVDLHGRVVVSSSLHRQNGKKGFLVDNATYNDGHICASLKSTETWSKKNEVYYDKGTARFGNGDDALYVHYDVYKDDKNAYFGSKDASNTFPIFGMAEFQSENIYRIETNEGITLYFITSGDEVPGYEAYLLGRRKDGVWVKYIDTRSVLENYFGKTNMNCRMIEVNDDTLIIKFGSPYAMGGKKYIEGAFRFKWDDAAQWFGVEKIMY